MSRLMTVFVHIDDAEDVLGVVYNNRADVWAAIVNWKYENQMAGHKIEIIRPTPTNDTFVPCETIYAGAAE